MPNLLRIPGAMTATQYSGSPRRSLNILLLLLGLSIATAATSAQGGGAGQPACTINVNPALPPGANQFQSIRDAAEAALPGDVVCIVPGLYHESVVPFSGGFANSPITYRSADNGLESVVVSGAEPIPVGSWALHDAATQTYRWTWLAGVGNTDDWDLQEYVVNNQPTGQFWFSAPSGFQSEQGGPPLAGPPHVYRREMLIARTLNPATNAPYPYPGVAAHYEGHVMRPVGSLATLTGLDLAASADPVRGVYGAYYVESDESAHPALRPPTAIYARFADGIAPSVAMPMIAARGRITLPLTLPDAATVQVHVFDLLGRQVATLADGGLEAGAHAVTFDAGTVPAGTYVVRALVSGAGARAERLYQRVTVVR